MSSARAPERRINQGVFISGSTGSGKSRMAQKLAHHWRRAVYIDPTRSFRDVETRFTNYTEATKFLAERWPAKPFRVGMTFSNDDDYTRLFAGLYNAAVVGHGTTDNVCVVLDEVDLWSNPRKIDPHISKLVRYGRHYGICWIAVCRADVETHRDVRMNATETILFRQGMLSPEMRRMVESAGNVRSEHMPDIARLQRWNFAGEPREGENFVALPDTYADWLPTWIALAKGRESR